MSSKKSSKGLGGGKTHGKKSHDDHISTLPAISRLMRHAGSVKHSKSAVEATRKVIEDSVEKIIKYALIYMEHARRKIISAKDIAYGFEKAFNKVAFESVVGKCQVKKKGNRTRRTKAIITTKFYVKQHDCIYIAPSPFRRYVKKIMKGYLPYAKISAKAAALLHAAVETETVELLTNALYLTVKIAKRTILYPEDIKAVEFIKNPKKPKKKALK